MKKERGKGIRRGMRRERKRDGARQRDSDSKREGTMTLDKTESTSGTESAKRKGNFVRQKACKRGRERRIVIHVREGNAKE